MRKTLCLHPSAYRTDLAPASGLKGLVLRAAPANSKRVVARCYTCGKGLAVAKLTPVKGESL